MPAPLKVLIVDDSEQDALLIVRELQQRGYEPAYERVEAPKAIKAALEQKAWDVVISNFVVSQCTALEVLALLQEKNLDLPFIIVSDTMSEDIAVNAKDAMPHGGTLTIATANVELDDQYVRGHLGTLPGSYVAISVADTGVGIPKEIHEQIFDPFFTTKEKSKGTGLGLATVYGIVKQSGGDIQVYSELGKGTTFKVCFPRVDEPLEVIEKKEGAEEAPRGNETILVVEDDSSVRKIAVQILMNQGYNVLVAESGGDALLICEQEKNPIHLVLTDVLMPKMSGPELIERLKKVRKDFKVLYMSGYTEKHVLKGLDKELNFIQKPFAIGVFAQKVRDVLDTKKGSKRK